MTNKPSEPIYLFDCATTQKRIGQEKFLEAFIEICNLPSTINNFME